MPASQPARQGAPAEARSLRRALHKLLLNFHPRTPWFKLFPRTCSHPNHQGAEAGTCSRPLGQGGGTSDAHGCFHRGLEAGRAHRPASVPHGMAGGAARLLLAALLVVPVAAQRELRFKPPAEAPVRLFTEPELARYDGQQVGAGGRPSRGGASGLRASPAFSLKPRGRAGAGGPGGARRRSLPRPAREAVRCYRSYSPVP